jgi:signal transduction histidine kinase
MTAASSLELPIPRGIRFAAIVMIVVMGAIGTLQLQGSWAAAVLLLLGHVLVQLAPERVEVTGNKIVWFLGAQAALTAGLLLLGVTNNAGYLFILFVTAGQAAILLPPATAWRWGLGLFAMMVLYSLLAWGDSGLINIAFNAAGYIFVFAISYFVRQAELARRHSQMLLQELQDAQEQLRALAILEERSRLAREMHDSLGHRLTVAVVQLEGAQRLVATDPQRASTMVGTMREQLKEALADLRQVVAELRVDEIPLPASLGRLARSFAENTGVLVHVNLPEGLPRLPEAHRLTLYRAAQEALTNAQRHAAAREVWLDLCQLEGSLIFTARDSGRPAAGGDQPVAEEGQLPASVSRPAAGEGGFLTSEGPPGVGGENPLDVSSQVQAGSDRPGRSGSHAEGRFDPPQAAGATPVDAVAASTGEGIPAHDASAHSCGGGYGLLGLRERAAQLGGSLEFDLLPGGGALLTLKIPLPEEG